jgi:hypothetical protein
VVVNTGEHLAFPSVGQVDPTREVHLPQVHRCLALPPAVLTLVPLLLRFDQAVAHQGPVDSCLHRNRLDTTLPQLEYQPPGAPSWM